MESNNVLDIESLRIDAARSRHDCTVDGHRWEFVAGADPIMRCRVCQRPSTPDSTLGPAPA